MSKKKSAGYTADRDPPITESISLQFCWCCGSVFFELGGTDPTCVRHTHHVVPQAAGGTDGPTVSICTHHHDLLHRIAESWMAQHGPLGTLPTGRALSMLNTVQSPRARSRVLYLAFVVAKSLLAVENDPHKPVFVTVRLSRSEAAELDLLGRVLNTKNRGETVHQAVKQALRKAFPLTTPKEHSP